MPIYEYKCKKCGKVFEVIQKFSDEPVAECQYCKGPVRKIFSVPAVVFKGSGFYVNDSRSSKSSTIGTSKAKPKTEHKAAAGEKKKEEKKKDDKK